MTATTKCSKKVWAAGGYSNHQCSNVGKVERDGKWYCGVHDPVAVKEKENKRNSFFRARLDASNKVRAAEKAKQAEIERRAGCYSDLIAVLIDLAEAGAEAWGNDRPCVKVAREVIAKATGVSNDQG